ncbi:MAG TPA: undecaprenyl-diphosphate phosphatase [Candidatus Alectryocaccobium stercorigallinarum]|jgi:undecaprenyl-diphosphatase|nr:undecaprenyl-diphosphate phosphatase [Candidatus Alectryocaccobium stercorigallinarum]
MLLNIIKVFILGIVEGITEWLPISSTGHLILVGDLLSPNFSADFTGLFNVVIQLGAIIAVIVIFFNRLWPFHTKKHSVVNQFLNPVSTGAAGKLQKFANNYLYMDKIVLWIKIAVSSIPALIAGLLFENWLEEHMHKPVPVAVMLIIYGVIFIVIENFNKHRRPRIKKTSQIMLRDALLIGCFQALALLPGTSRSGATIVGALILGLSRVCAAEYSFFLAVPAMLGASAIKLFDFGFAFSAEEIICLVIGMAVSFVVSMFVIKALMSFVAKHDFKVFGYYRIVLGVAVIAAAGFGLIG